MDGGGEEEAGGGEEEVTHAGRGPLNQEGSTCKGRRELPDLPFLRAICTFVEYGVHAMYINVAHGRALLLSEVRAKLRQEYCVV